ncbi:hypothetical protein FOS14_23400 [Skermania sp. ID1734]|uniref:ester cyclase n=1 Tax=Skermania sp. ID1734 TaxID=2597516 RepID=UPI00118043E3|nr:ester cyclase [Skermania sp. ID1734]TSD93249.1 hypothetical protein FOS14_23400 [Skermania sp. ID1734]
MSRTPSANPATPASSSTLTADITDYHDRFISHFDQRLTELAPRWQHRAEPLRAWAHGWITDGYLTHNLESIVSWVTDDFINIDPVNYGRDRVGPAEFLTALQETSAAFPDYTFLPAGPPALSLEGDVIVIPWRAMGTFAGPLRVPTPGKRPLVLAPTNRRFNFRGVDVYTFTGDKVSRLHSHYDALDVLTQIGLLPTLSPLAHAIALPQHALARLQRHFTRR